MRRESIQVNIDTNDSTKSSGYCVEFNDGRKNML